MAVDPADDVASPELALVDSALRERLLERDPVRPPWEVDIARVSYTPPPSKRRRSTRRISLVILAAVIALVASVIAFQRLTRTAASSTTGTSPAITSSGHVLAWAPVAGAAAYDVEIRRGSNVVYSTRTLATHVRVPAHWQRGSRSRVLSPGTYHWYVWPLTATGSRQSAAIVATTFVVTG